MESYNQIINGDKPVLIDFFATWCAPCKSMTPIVEAIGKEVQGNARVLKIDIDKNQALAAQYGIQAVPTFLILKKGQVVWRKSGGTDKNSLKSELLRHL